MGPGLHPPRGLAPFLSSISLFTHLRFFHLYGLFRAEARASFSFPPSFLRFYTSRNWFSPLLTPWKFTTEGSSLFGSFFFRAPGPPGLQLPFAIVSFFSFSPPLGAPILASWLFFFRICFLKTGKARRRSFSTRPLSFLRFASPKPVLIRLFRKGLRPVLIILRPFDSHHSFNLFPDLWQWNPPPRDGHPHRSIFYLHFFLITFQCLYPPYPVSHRSSRFSLFPKLMALFFPLCDQLVDPLSTTPSLGGSP